MADFSVTIAVPDVNVAELSLALQQAWNLPGANTATLRARYKTECTTILRDIFHNYRQRQRELAADDTINIT